jgi:hypothetical protein
MKKVFLALSLVCLSFVQVNAQKKGSPFLSFQTSLSFVGNISKVNDALYNSYSDYEKKSMASLGAGFGVGYAFSNKISLLLDCNYQSGSSGSGKDQYKKLSYETYALKLEGDMIKTDNIGLSVASGVSLNITTFFYSRNDQDDCYSFTSGSLTLPIETTFWFLKSNENGNKLKANMGIFAKYNVDLIKGTTKVTGVDREIKDMNIGINNFEIGLKIRLY